MESMLQGPVKRSFFLAQLPAAIILWRKKVNFVAHGGKVGYASNVYENPEEFDGLRSYKLR